jgi:hypothetical protein
VDERVDEPPQLQPAWLQPRLSAQRSEQYMRPSRSTASPASTGHVQDGCAQDVLLAAMMLSSSFVADQSSNACATAAAQAIARAALA